ncbi:hypothetical protein G5I_12228 [Acromyrmex echinatior]|uniref:Uncharacterized protein n=1 Tax=Acromyrmex echinatior TaxID=103372 RepID=F4X1R4_ACREC|nr:hypothetical protein G5I_12228 [Acromyrmex echinatior]
MAARGIFTNIVRSLPGSFRSSTRGALCKGHVRLQSKHQRLHRGTVMTSNSKKQAPAGRTWHQDVVDKTRGFPLNTGGVSWLLGEDVFNLSEIMCIVEYTISDRLKFLFSVLCSFYCAKPLTPR